MDSIGNAAAWLATIATIAAAVRLHRYAGRYRRDSHRARHPRLCRGCLHLWRLHAAWGEPGPGCEVVGCGCRSWRPMDYPRRTA